MKRRCSLCILLLSLLTGCSGTTAQTTEPLSTAASTAAATEAIPAATAAATVTAPATQPPETTGPAESAPPETAPETLPPETEPAYETFTGILIDEDCSDFEEPELHDLPCMLMDSCRASGYGLDIQNADGTWQFIPFDETGQELAWDYLLQTSQQDHLYVVITGTVADGVIHVTQLQGRS